MLVGIISSTGSSFHATCGTRLQLRFRAASLHCRCEKPSCAGDREPMLAMLPWPLRDALGQDLQRSSDQSFGHFRTFAARSAGVGPSSMPRRRVGFSLSTVWSNNVIEYTVVIYDILRPFFFIKHEKLLHLKDPSFSSLMSPFVKLSNEKLRSTMERISDAKMPKQQISISAVCTCRLMCLPDYLDV